MSVGVLELNERLKVKTEVSSGYTSHIHWVVWGTGTPKDRDEVKRSVQGDRFESVKGECVI
jgi:hypothetical protein